MSAAGSFSYGVYAKDASNSAQSTTTTFAGTVTNPTYNQTELIAGITKIKAIDITELRTMIANVASYYGATAPVWASGSLTAGVTLIKDWTIHVTELRTAIDNIRTHVNSWDSTNTTLDIPAISWTAIAANKPTAAVMNQIRSAIATL